MTETEITDLRKQLVRHVAGFYVSTSALLNEIQHGPDLGSVRRSTAAAMARAELDRFSGWLHKAGGRDFLEELLRDGVGRAET